MATFTGTKFAHLMFRPFASDHIGIAHERNWQALFGHGPMSGAIRRLWNAFTNANNKKGRWRANRIGRRVDVEHRFLGEPALIRKPLRKSNL
jgi:hypothetical protein